ncbi:MAG TPA: GAF domain-containing protein, partial [Verrucomicrobiae bacterium]|nr:GAF domain-containing protein [Verrucomicrobiae bacterium]
MKTALLLTNSAETQRLLTDILGERTNLVLLPPPSEATREKFDALFATWLRLADAVILDAASLGAPSRWAIESLAAAKIEERQAVVVRAAAGQQAMYSLAPHWLAVSDTDSAEQLQQALGTFFELREAQAKLKRADAVITRQRQTARASSSSGERPMRASGIPPAAFSTSSSNDLYRYRAAIKSISQLLGRHPNRNALWRELLGIVRELLGVGKLAIFAGTFRTDLAGEPAGGRGETLAVVASAGIAQEVVGHLRLTADAGIGGYLTSEAKILRRAQLFDPLALDFDPQIAHEFELLGTEVAVPMFDNDRLFGVLTFSGRITGEPLANEELELAYHLLTQIAQAIHSFDLLDQIAGQQRLFSEVLANVQSGGVVVDQGNRIRCINRR